MRWIVLADLPKEDLKSDPDFDWAMHPQFCRIEWEDEDEELKVLWTVGLLHRHWNTPDNRTSPPDMFRCGLINRSEVTNNAFPEHECDKCGKSVPKNIVEQKIDRIKSLKGVDPRNDRRGAVLATRDSNLIDTKES
jgi:hypothetical protein